MKKKKEKVYKFPSDQRIFNKLESDSIKKVGWYTHFVFNESPDEFPYGTNIHTHGIAENFDHLDLQFCMRVSPEIANGIMWAAFRLIKSGTKLEPGKEYNDILTGYKVKAILARELLIPPKESITCAPVIIGIRPLADPPTSSNSTKLNVSRCSAWIEPGLSMLLAIAVILPKSSV